MQHPLLLIDTKPQQNLARSGYGKTPKGLRFDLRLGGNELNLCLRIWDLLSHDSERMAYGGVPLAKLAQESLSVVRGEWWSQLAHLPLSMSIG